MLCCQLWAFLGISLGCTAIFILTDLIHLRLFDLKVCKSHVQRLFVDEMVDEAGWPRCLVGLGGSHTICQHWADAVEDAVCDLKNRP